MNNKGKKMTMTELKEKIPLRDYAWAKEQMDKGLLVRRKGWVQGRFIWYQKARSKQVYPDRNDAFSILPIDMVFLKKHGVKRLLIGGHINCWWQDTHSIQVGFIVMGKDRSAGDWELHTE